MAAFERALSCRAGEADPTGAFGLRWMECLAACDAAPCALVDDDLYERLAPDAVGLVLDHVRGGGGGGTVVRRADGTPELVPAPLRARPRAEERP
jgi:hypothetical protein